MTLVWILTIDGVEYEYDSHAELRAVQKVAGGRSRAQARPLPG
jgi:hypothetical protein